MSSTLFRYIFKNLLLVFGLASAVIAGIMSFGGLLKPLTEQGLDVTQVVRMLAYAMPAMQTYSFPVAALFATTVVFGRMAADNEVTAVRAAGISLGPLGLGLPAVVLGLIVSLVSLLFLSFIVPAATLQVERTLVSNIGQFVVNRIQQQHQVRLQQASSQPLTIYAQSARMEPPDPLMPNQQVVTLNGVSIVTYSSDDDKLRVPEEFFIARQARAYIRQPEDASDDEKPVLLQASLVDGMKFPRSFTNRRDAAIQGGVRIQQFGPFALRSPLRENTKFMDVRKLQELERHPEKSRRLTEILGEFIRTDQQQFYLETLLQQINGPRGSAELKAGNGEVYRLFRGSAEPRIERGRLIISGTSTTKSPSVRMIQNRPDQPSVEAAARSARVRAVPDESGDRIAVTLTLEDATLDKAAFGEYEKSFAVAMPDAVRELQSRTSDDYINRSDLSDVQRRSLNRNLMKQNNSVKAEQHSRVSFAMSCLILTIVGYGLGMMFRSGNFLGAFSVSVVPALLSIVLTVTGQHICQNVPPDIGENFKNPLQMGLIVIWSGNAIVLGMAVFLLARLRAT